MWVRMCTNTAKDPIVSWKDGCLGILNRSHEFFKCGSEGWVLLLFVSDDAALKRRISNFHTNVNLSVITHIPPSCAWVLTVMEVTIP